MENPNYKLILKEKQYIKLVFANFINRFGDSIDTVAYMWLVYNITGSASWSVIIYAFNKIPNVLFQPFAGALVEKLNKKKVMILVDMLRGILVILLILLYNLNLVNTYILVTFTLLNSFAEIFRLPASMAYLPKILKKTNYKFGLSFNSTIVTVSELIGFGISGVLVYKYNISFAIFIDALTFFLSALFIFSITEQKNTEEDKNSIHEKYFVRLKEGIKYIKTKKIVLNFCLMAIVVNALLVPFNSLQIPLISEEFGGNSIIISIINVCLLLGMALGSFLTPYITKLLSVNNIISFFGVGIGVSYLGFAITHIIKSNIFAFLAICILESFFFGLSISLINTILRIQFMTTVDKDYLSRAGAIFNAGGSAASPLTSFIVSLFVVRYSVSSIFFVSGIICIIFFFFIRIYKVKYQ